MPLDRHSAGGGPRTVLFIAQLPPPHHGQSAMAAIMHEVFKGDAGLEVTRMWHGGARANDDIGRRDFAKYLGFVRLVLELVALRLSGRRFDLAYLGFAPWAHTALRDALLSWLAMRLSTRVLVHVHGEGLSALLEGRSWRSRLVRSCLSGAELLAITSDTAHEAAQSRVFSRVVALPNMAVDPGEPRNQPSSSLVVSCLGNLDPRKGVLDFIDVVRALSRRDVQVQANIVGGPTAFLTVEALRARVADFGLTDRITVTGRVSEEDKAAILAASDIFLYLSRHDLSPVALIEALSHGNAPIVLDTGGLREMVGAHLAANVLQAGLSEELVGRAADRIATYAENRELLEHDRARARTQYFEAYHPDAFRARVLGLIAEGPLAGEAAPAGKGLLARGTE